MANFNPLDRQGNRVDWHILQNSQRSPLQRILCFMNLSIDDVIDDPIARTAVWQYWRITNLVSRRCAAVDAEHMTRRRLAGESLIIDDEQDALSRSRKKMI